MPARVLVNHHDQSLFGRAILEPLPGLAAHLPERALEAVAKLAKMNEDLHGEKKKSAQSTKYHLVDPVSSTV